MLRHALFLLFLYGIKNCSSSSDVQEQAIEPKDVHQNGIKKNEVGANGLEVNWEKVFTNFRNPVLEYLLHTNSDRMNDPSKKGVVREIRHSQVLLIPNFPRSSLPPFFINLRPQFESLKKPSEEGARNPESSPVGTFWNFLKNKTPMGDETYKEGVVTSPVLYLNKDADEAKEETRIQTYPAVAVVINTFGKDGSLKKSITHFQPDFNSIRPEKILGGAKHPAQGSNANKISNINSSHNTVKNFVKWEHGDSGLSGKNTPHGWPWPFSNYFPIVINDPFLTMYNAFAKSMYNAVSSMVEYGPAAHTCRKDQERDSGSDKLNIPGLPERKKQTTSVVPGWYIYGGLEEDIFGEVTMQSESLKRVHDKVLAKEKPEEGDRKKRDTTSIFVKSKEGDTVDISLKEPPDVKGILANSQDERARSFSQVLVNTPPLSTILRPPQQGYADKRRKAKPSKPAKEEGSSEEVGEEQEEESTNQSQENANEAVAISPPPEGASVAEAKPIGLAIAGPGGVAASKPQGTAVAGPGGLAIARPVGTAIAGVDVEGSVPIGGQQKNKKKPKQEHEQTEAELHYVGGLTGPIGNPQPKEFADSIYYKTVKDTQGNNVHENLFFRGVPNANGFQLRLGQQNGNAGHGYDQFPRYETQF